PRAAPPRGAVLRARVPGVRVPAGGVVAWRHDNLLRAARVRPAGGSRDLTLVRDERERCRACAARRRRAESATTRTGPRRVHAAAHPRGFSTSASLGANAGWLNKISTLAMVSWTTTCAARALRQEGLATVFRELNELQYHELVDGGRRVRYTDAHSIVTAARVQPVAHGLRGSTSV
ncbi:hypothetical protein PINS_up021020, partial [Pythium insidiosum]